MTKRYLVLIHSIHDFKFYEFAFLFGLDYANWFCIKFTESLSLHI